MLSLAFNLHLSRWLFYLSRYSLRLFYLRILLGERSWVRSLLWDRSRWLFIVRDRIFDFFETKLPIQSLWECRFTWLLQRSKRSLVCIPCIQLNSCLQCSSQLLLINMLSNYLPNDLMLLLIILLCSFYLSRLLLLLLLLLLQILWVYCPLIARLRSIEGLDHSRRRACNRSTVIVCIEVWINMMKDSTRTWLRLFDLIAIGLYQGLLWKNLAR